MTGRFSRDVGSLSKRRVLLVLLFLAWLSNVTVRLYLNNWHPAGGYFVWAFQILLAAFLCVVFGMLAEQNLRQKNNKKISK